LKIIHFADLHLGIESYGRTNPETGLSVRLEDFLNALDKVVAYALDNRIDLVLFSGDAYKSREPTPTQQREFARRIKRLASHGVPVFLLVGNHDLPNALGRATATEIFDTLEIENVIVARRPDIFHITTTGGPVQIVALPWLRRSNLMAMVGESRHLSFEQINQRLQQVLARVIAEHAARLDHGLPTILAAHVWVMGAQIGSEKAMTIGQEPKLLLSNVTQPGFDYIALGHIHKQQVLSTQPPVVYSGSLERVDFGEENDAKGFYVVEIGDRNSCGLRPVTFNFQALEGRRFLTIASSINPGEDPTSKVIQDILAQQRAIPGAIVRLHITLPAQMEGQLRDNEIRNYLNEAFYFTIAREVRREPRFRIGQWTAEKIAPGEALERYLDMRKFSPGQRARIKEGGTRLIEELDTRLL
jgi:exonuclease SbcD